jgi:hypothetical protein
MFFQPRPDPGEPSRFNAGNSSRQGMYLRMISEFVYQKR